MRPLTVLNMVPRTGARIAMGTPPRGVPVEACLTAQAAPGRATVLAAIFRPIREKKASGPVLIIVLDGPYSLENSLLVLLVETLLSRHRNQTHLANSWNSALSSFLFPSASNFARAAFVCIPTSKSAVVQFNHQCDYD
jgi:hypothetical protein